MPEGVTGKSGHSIYQEYNSEGEYEDSHDESRKTANEHSNLTKEEIARQREERLKQRLLRRENNLNLNENSQTFNQDENSQASNGSSGYSYTHMQQTSSTSSGDFNIRNYFLMHKGLFVCLLIKLYRLLHILIKCNLFYVLFNF